MFVAEVMVLMAVIPAEEEEMLGFHIVIHCKDLLKGSEAMSPSHLPPCKVVAAVGVVAVAAVQAAALLFEVTSVGFVVVLLLLHLAKTIPLFHLLPCFSPNQIIIQIGKQTRV